MNEVLQRVEDVSIGTKVFNDIVEGRTFREDVRTWIKVYVKELRMKEAANPNLPGI